MTLQINYKSSHFPSGRVARSGALATSWDELLWAAITVGRPSTYHVFRHGPASFHEAIFRLALTRMVIEETPSGLLRRTDAFAALDPTEKGMVSYFLGMTLCKLFSSRLLSTPWLLHLDVFRQNLNVNNLGRSRPDLLGEDDHGNWHAFESKGRSSVPSAGDKDKAKDQAQRLVAVGGLSTQLHVGSFAFFRNGILEFFWRDPEPVADEPLDVPAPNEEWRYYYEPALRLASKMESDALAAEQTLADVTVEIQHEILALLSEGAWLKAKKIAQERSSSLVAEGYQPDGIKVRAGDSWRKPYESIERE